MTQDIKRKTIGTYKKLKIEIVTWDGVTAEVDLSCGCLFHHEINGMTMQGGLADLDHALDGKIHTIRDKNLFDATRFDHLLLNQSQTSIYAPQVLLIGMGDPEEWTLEHTAKAVQIAYKVGNSLGVSRVAFAPSLLDTGLKPEGDLGGHLLQAVIQAHHAYIQMEQLGLVKKATIQNWIFDAGDHQFDEKAEHYIQAFQQLILNHEK
ncbi:peptidase M17 [Acinetobacter sp. S40]|uniref:M17 family peptidase N-terminal domain-containing protein n=1 Tax=Acinetobacter sp. S40 TaxID=2767434 RepID=UPI00190A4688|nr:M17 family peptidase N-terminal domain-containing protein [Acinetobacter sp. S40]MBJ9985603.1 peptidase M17 [Acinetobacter sp. S40]